MLGLLALGLSLTLLLILVLNPSSDRQSQELFQELATAAHLLIAVGAGYGLVLLGMRVSATNLCESPLEG